MEDQFKEAFKEETTDVIASIDNLLVDLEENSDNEDNKILLFRHLHTIKGGAGMFGYVKIADLVHEIETVLEPYKQGEVKHIKAEVINHLLSSMDFIKFLMDSEEQELGNFDQTKEHLITGLGNGLGGGALTSGSAITPVTESSVESALSAVEAEDEEDFSLFRIDLELSEDFLFTGSRPHYLLNDLTELGEMRTFADTSRIPMLTDLDTGKFYLRWVILLASLEPQETVEDVFLFIGGESSATVTQLKSGASVDQEKLQETLAKITEFGFDLSEVHDLLDNSELLSPLLEIETVSSEPVVSEPAEISAPVIAEEPASILPSSHLSESLGAPVAKPVVSPASQTAPTPPASALAPAVQRIRVDSKRLDSLVDLVGELVTIQARLSQKLKEGDQKEMDNIAEKLDFIVQELRDVTTEMRMIPIQGTFSKFQRLVRDLSQELGKKVEYITQGGETELDKNIIEKLDEPLVHLIRNSLDHGIETPEERLAKGKPEKSILKIMAQQNGAHISIQIQDDGKGLDRNAIGERAVERGIVESYEGLSDDAIYDFIFSPGFSTAAQVTNLSGRGVGLSVVKSQVESLRGNINIKTEEGVGTTFSLIFPLTLAIIDGFLVRVGHEYFVVPLTIVEACLEFKTTELTRIQEEGGGFMSFREKALPSLELRGFFEIEGAKPDIQQIVIVRTDQTMIGIVVDEVIGKHQTVIKSLGEVYRNVKGVSSATILGDGGIALLLDVEAIVDLHLLQKIEPTTPVSISEIALTEEEGAFS